MRDLQEAADAYYTALDRVMPHLIESPVQVAIQTGLRHGQSQRGASTKPKKRASSGFVYSNPQNQARADREAARRGRPFKRHEKKIAGITVPTTKRGLKRQALRALG